MMRNLLILPELPVVPPGSGIRHIATSYEVSRSPYLETTFNNTRDEAAIIVSNLKDTVNLTSYNITIADMTEETEIYARHKLHYEINGQEFDTGWSSVINMKGDQEGFRVADVIIQTPELRAKRRAEGIYRNYLEVDATSFMLFLGYGEHKSTSWRVTDSDNKVIAEVKRSVDLLNKVVFPIDDWDPSKVYIVQCQYHSTTNADSLWGKLIWCENADIGTDVHFYIKNLPAIAGRDLLIGVRLHTSRMSSLDFTLKDPRGNIVASIVGHILQYYIQIQKIKSLKIIDFIATLPYILPGTFYGLGYVLAFNSYPLKITGTALIVILNLIFKQMQVLFWKMQMLIFRELFSNALSTKMNLEPCLLFTLQIAA